MGRRLTEEEVQKLPSGTKVLVYWKGAAKPHLCEIYLDGHGVRLAKFPETGIVKSFGRVTKRPNTEVRLVED